MRRQVSRAKCSVALVRFPRFDVIAKPCIVLKAQKQIAPWADWRLLS